MTICPDCEKKYVSTKQYEIHKRKVHPTSETEKSEEPETPEVVNPEVEGIVLHFARPVEITVNGKLYAGTDVEVPDYAVASDIARIAREAYGNDILI